MFIRVLLAICLFLTTSIVANQRIDTTVESHEMIIKLQKSLSEKPLSELPEIMQSLTLTPFSTNRVPPKSHRAKLLTRLFQVSTLGMTAQEMLQLSKKLENLKEVEYCSLSPIERAFQKRKRNRMTPPPPTPDFSDKQGYLKDTVNGIYAEYAWSLGVFGEGVTFRDVEGAWDMEHEDLANLFVGLAPTSTEWMDHGTNTIGVMMGQHNGFGIKGATPKAKMYTYSVQNEHGINNDPGRTFAIAKAVEDARAGDIIILELQDRGLDGSSWPDYGPADVKIPVWDLVKAATSDSILVVAASGNGKQNLDGSAYSSYRARGDNGSILVAGGKPEDQSKTSSSGYGEMVRLQGWGYYVTTTGGHKIKDYILQSGSHADYTSGYSGTSSATPVVAAAMGLVQSWAKEHQSRYLGPYEMRELLVATGTPATGDKNIGPLPNVKAAIEKLEADSQTAVTGAFKSVSTLSIHSISSNKMQLQIPKSGVYTISIYSLKGQQISSYKEALSQGVSTIAIKSISSGIYMVSIEGISYNHIEKVIIH